MTVADRVTGAMLGLALGDALGAPFTGLRADRIARPLPGPGSPEPGRAAGTDATALARNLARSLAAAGGLDADDVVERHLGWFRSGPADVEAQTYRVLRRIEGDGDPDAPPARRARAAAEAEWRERGPEVSAGNGSVSWCTPLGLAHARRPEALPTLAPALSGLTHHDPRCGTAVTAVTTGVAALCRGRAAVEAVLEALGAVEDREGGEELEFLVEAVGRSRPVDGPDQGFCLFAAAVGLRAAASGGPFETALAGVVALGGDTAANGAVAGALLGAREGARSLPEDRVRWLPDAPGLRMEAEALVPLALSEGPPAS